MSFSGFKATGWASGRAIAVASALAIMAAAGMAGAATPAATAPAAAAPAASAPDLSTDTQGPASVNGFRSATFGMTAADVKAAIVKDFNVKADAITSGENTAERTQLLSVAVPDLLPGGGTAQVSYVFGYKSKTLIQVGVSWSTATDSTITEAELYADGDVLRTHFTAGGYKPDTIKTGLVLQNGLLLFRGEDADGHATILILQGQFKDAADGKQKTLTPTSLALLYSASPQNPDVFKLAPGQF
jgi:hypothetical protein